MVKELSDIDCDSGEGHRDSNSAGERKDDDDENVDVL